MVRGIFIPLVFLGVLVVFWHSVGLTLIGQRRSTDCCLFVVRSILREMSKYRSHRMIFL